MKTLLKIIGIMMWIITFALWCYIVHSGESSFLDGFLSFIAFIVMNILFDCFLSLFAYVWQDTERTMDKIKDKLLK